MKKSLISAAVLMTVAGAAQAQSSVTVYGIADIGIETLSNQVGGSKTFMAGVGGMAPTLWGIKGSEDLGGGMKAMFTLEGSMNMGTGAGTGSGLNSNGGLFGREASVGISGGFGTVKFGLQLDPAFISYVETDPRGAAESFSGLNFWINGIKPSNGTSNTNAFVNIFDSNAITYSYSAAGFSVTALYSVGGVAGNTSANSLWSVGGNYKNGPLMISAGAFQNKTNPAAGSGISAQTNLSEYNIGASYAFGPATVKANYVDMKPGAIASATPEIATYGLGLEYAVSAPLKLNVAYYNSKDKTNSGKMTMLTAGAEYSLSKRTALYGQLVSSKLDASGYSGSTLVDVNGGVATAGNTTTGGVVGIRHLF